MLYMFVFHKLGTIFCLPDNRFFFILHSNVLGTQEGQVQPQLFSRDAGGTGTVLVMTLGCRRDRDSRHLLRVQFLLTLILCSVPLPRTLCDAEV